MHKSIRKKALLTDRGNNVGWTYTEYVLYMTCCETLQLLILYTANLKPQLLLLDTFTSIEFSMSDIYFKKCQDQVYHRIHEEISPPPCLSLHEVWMWPTGSHLEGVRLSEYLWSLDIVHQAGSVVHWNSLSTGCRQNGKEMRSVKV